MSTSGSPILTRSSCLNTILGATTPLPVRVLERVCRNFIEIAPDVGAERSLILMIKFILKEEYPWQSIELERPSNAWDPE